MKRVQDVRLRGHGEDSATRKVQVKWLTATAPTRKGSSQAAIREPRDR